MAREVFVLLKHVANALRLQGADGRVLVDRGTGIVLLIRDGEAKIVGKPHGMRKPDPADVLTRTDDLVPMPADGEIDGWKMMEAFVEQRLPDLRDPVVQQELREAIRQPKGSFGRFNRIVQMRGLRNAWMKYRQKSLERMAAFRLEEAGVKYR